MKECEREEHEKHRCPEREVECSYGCGIKGLKFREKAAHEQKHAKVQAAEDAKRQLFEQSLVRVEPIPCPRCKGPVLPRKLDWHLDKECPERVKVVNVRLGAAVKARAYEGTDTAMRGRLPPVTLPYHPALPPSSKMPL